jgi:MFS superfamily sulfate permease-like transporter
LGLIQLALGFIKAGSISNYFPTNVIEGMLAGIGVIIILKQIPCFWYDANFEGDQSLFKVMVAIPSPHYLRFLTIFN